MAKTDEGSSLLGLPYEILRDVTQHLSISDCARLRRVTKDGRFGELLADRIKPEVHFARLLSDATDFLRILAETNVVLAHENALWYFFPSIISPSSIWTFIAPACVRRQEMFLKFMRDQGVVWATCRDILVAKFKARKTFTMAKNVFLRATEPMDSEGFQEIRQKTKNASGDFVWVRMDDIWTFHVSERDEDDPHGERPWVSLEGRLVRNGTTQRVVLTYDQTGQRSVQDYLHQMATSVQQCFIGGFGALHLYGSLTDSNIVRQWSDNISHEVGQQPDLTNFAKVRGGPNPTGRRHTFDNGCLLVPYEKSEHIPEGYWQHARRNALCFDWEELEGQTKRCGTRWSRPLFSSDADMLYAAHQLPSDVDYDYLLEHGIS